MFTYIPISLVALLVKPQWNTIKHHNAKSIEDFNNAGVETAREFARENVSNREDVTTEEDSDEALLSSE